MQDTICAISTPHGTGGIAVIRVSGPEAVSLADKLFAGKRPLREAQSHTMHYGRFADLDDVMAGVFRAPHSFTGEDTVEISCHGSAYIQQEILHLLCTAGCRLAHAGEFTERAFLNGRMDLTEAEAVADLIAAESRAAHNLALSHLRGGISHELNILRERLLHFTSLIELELDFADHEELEFADRSQLSLLADELETHISRLLESFKLGNALKNGIPAAIIGPTNAGKSTLLNALAGEERAIVSDEQGTTRDTIEDVVTLGGVQFRFIDTAGLRHTDNRVEQQGIERSLNAARRADVILLVDDASRPSERAKLPAGIDAEGKIIIHVHNKADLLTARPADKTEEPPYSVYIAAKQGETDKLKDLLQSCYSHENNYETVTISNIRHRDALRRALNAIQHVKAGITDNLSGEFLAMDLQDCLQALGEITGQITSQEVLNNIFSRFCIGK